MEIPTLSEEEKWEMMREIFVLNKQVDIGFIMQLGQEKMSEAIVRKNLMGSDVEVDGNAGEVTLNLKRT